MWRANSQLYIAALMFPMCTLPVGDGAKRTLASDMVVVLYQKKSAPANRTGALHLSSLSTYFLAFFAGAFFAGAFFAAGFLAGAFLQHAFLAQTFFAAGFLAGAFLAGAFLATFLVAMF